MDYFSGEWAACLFKWATREPHVVLLLHSANVRVNEVRLLSLGVLRLLRSSRAPFCDFASQSSSCYSSGDLTTSSQVHLALTQPDACGAGESLGDVEIGSSGGVSQNLQNSKSHSSESNREHLFAYAAEAIW